MVYLPEHPPHGAVPAADEQPERRQSPVGLQAEAGPARGQVKHLGRVQDLAEAPEEALAVAVAGLGVDEDDERGSGEGGLDGHGRVGGGGGGRGGALALAAAASPLGGGRAALLVLVLLLVLVADAAAPTSVGLRIWKTQLKTCWPKMYGNCSERLCAILFLNHQLVISRFPPQESKAVSNGSGESRPTLDADANFTSLVGGTVACLVGPSEHWVT